MSTLDEVIETVRGARADGPEALAAMALSFGATMALGTLRIHALRGQIVELRAAQTAADEMVATLRHERDAALAECKAARQSVDEAKADAARLRALVESAADTAEVWRLRESVAAVRADRARAVAERDRAVQEREAFSLRLSAAERERDEARAERDASDERWATVCRERHVALAERDAVQALHAELVATRADFGHQRNITEDALRERDEARAERDALRDRPTYEARTVAPARRELERHKAEHGRWLVTWQESPVPSLCSEVVAGVWPTMTYPVGAVYLPLDASGIPCAWPVPSAEVSP